MISRRKNHHTFAALGLAIVFGLLGAACGDDDTATTDPDGTGSSADDAGKSHSPQTEGALQEAVAAGDVVCTDTGGSDDAAASSGGTAASLESDGCGPKDFTIGSCANEGENDIVLTAQADGLTLEVSALEGFGEPGGTATLAVSGGGETDGITLNGTVRTVVIGDDGTFTVLGVFTEPNNAGEDFTLTGSCSGG